MPSTKDVLTLFNIHAKKKLGQNFLMDEAVLCEIVELADVNENDLVIEIGPGVGSLTKHLCERAKKVVVIELDESLKKPFDYMLNGINNFSWIQGDVLKMDIPKLIGELKADEYEKVKIVANLPYYITTPIISKLLKESDLIDTMVFMVQKEVAMRVVSKEGSKIYGVLSIATQVYADAELGFIVPKEAFNPIPKVDSAVLRLDVLKNDKYGFLEKEKFLKLIKAAFSQRRKTLINSLSAGLSGATTKDEIREVLIGMDLDERIRPEKISVEDYVKIAKTLDVTF